MASDPPADHHPEPAGDPPGDLGGDRPLVLVLLGPTASGKTELAIGLARSLDLAVLNVDSRQLYRGMDVGTAKPTAAQQAQARHELLDLRDPDQPINLQEFRALAAPLIAAEHRRTQAAAGGPMALLAGGSGLYLKALTQGLQPPAVPPQPELRAQLVALGQPVCHQLLQQADPIAAARIAAADAVRTQRALEVLYATGRPLSAQQGATPPAWRVVELGLDPPDLQARIQTRTRGLFAAGLVAETEQLIGRYGAALPLLDTIGYREARQLLAGELDEAEAIRITGQRTRQFAKRQRTWFRRQHRPIWLEAGRPETRLQQALQEIERVLG
ncbi:MULTISPECIES: tRNA (adenosine(37)-N6)-dimethylallyltransferase MiaA [Aphanothece]|uniref:tRNA (adenosine(37)-N6)-dimethylallyltransferase MiaA n=1 Tax=Aphanothece TaxID=1121 RepID=UPI0039848E6B